MAYALMLALILSVPLLLAIVPAVAAHRKGSLYGSDLGLAILPEAAYWAGLLVANKLRRSGMHSRSSFR